MKSNTYRDKRLSELVIATFVLLISISFGSQATTINVTVTNQIGDVDYVVNGNCSFYEAAEGSKPK